MDLLTRRVALTSLLGLVSLAAVLVYGDRGSGEPRAIRVLFIGNGYTEANDLPGLVRALGEWSEPASVIDVVRRTEPGATLQSHWAKGRAAELIAAGRFDYVVLQEQSMMPAVDAESMAASARRFDAEIRRSGAKTVLMMTWAQRDRAGMIDPIAEAYERVGRDTGAVVAPVGRAWETALGAGDAPALHEVDGSSPTRAGSYLTACVLYETLTGRDCRGLGNAGLRGVTPSEARRMQNAAHATVHGG